MHLGEIAIVYLEAAAEDSAVAEDSAAAEDSAVAEDSAAPADSAALVVGALVVDSPTQVARPVQFQLQLLRLSTTTFQPLTIRDQPSTTDVLEVFPAVFIRVPPPPTTTVTGV